MSHALRTDVCVLMSSTNVSAECTVVYLLSSYQLREVHRNCGLWTCATYKTVYYRIDILREPGANFLGRLPHLECGMWIDSKLRYSCKKRWQQVTS